MMTAVAGPPGTLRLEGEIDMSSVPLLRDALAKAREDGGPLSVDLAGVGFIDSSGLHELVTAALSLNGEAPLVLLNVPPSIARLLKIVGMDELPSLEVRTAEAGR